MANVVRIDIEVNEKGTASAKAAAEHVEKPMKEAAKKIDASFDQTARQVGRYLYQIEREAWSSGRGMDDAFSESSRAIRADLNKIREAAAKTGQGLESDLGQALKSVRDKASQLGESIKPASGGKSGSGLIDQLIGDVPKGAAAAAGAGALVGKFVLDGIQAEFAEDRVGGLLAAQTGAVESAAEGLGNTAGQVFGDNFGDSVEDVGAAMKAVFENHLIDVGAAQSDIASVTEKVITLGQVTGEEFGRISSATSRMVKTGIAGSVSEAMNLIGHAQEKGLNAQGDLIDTIEEYSTKFRDLGLNGAEAFGLIDQAMEGGARNTDIAADALKEFSIRAQDMSVLTRRGFEQIGLNADDMGQRMAKGGASAKSALQDTLNALEAMPPGIQRNSAAVDLFGTKAEDLGKALYDMDLDDAAKQFGDFGGTVEEQMKKISDATSFWDKIGKGISNAAAGLGEFLDQDASEMLDQMPELRDRLEEVNKAQHEFDATGSTEALDALKRKYPELSDTIDAYIKKKRDEKDATDSAAESTSIYVDTIDKLISKQKEASEGVLGLSEATIAHEQAIDAADQALKENGKTLDLTTEKGRDNQSALNDLASTTFDVIDAMRAQGATAQDVQGYMSGARQSFIDHAIAMGMDATQANILADKLNLIPGTYGAKVIVDSSQAVPALNAVRNAIAGIPRNVNIAITQTLAAFGKHSSGGVVGIDNGVWGAATGGSRHSSTIIDEAGPEMVELPTGARVMTAGATRAMADAGAFGGGGATQIVASWAGTTDPLIKAIMGAIRLEVKDFYGGSSNAAFNQRGVD